MGLFDSVVGSVAGAIGLPGVVKRFGSKIANSKALKFGAKVAGGAVRIGSKMSSVGKAISHGADVVGKYSGKVASITSGVPVVGAVAGLLDKGVKIGHVAGSGLQAGGGALSSAGKAAQGVIRVGRSAGNMKTGGDLISTVRDLERASGKMGGASHNLVSQARSIGTTLHRRK